MAPRPRGRESLGHALLLQLLPLPLPLSEDLAGQGIRELLQNKAAVGLPSYVSRICYIFRFEMPTISSVCLAKQYADSVR